MLNNNISNNENYNLHGLAGTYTNIPYDFEYDSFAAKQAEPTSDGWAALTFETPLMPSGLGEYHRFKLAITDVGLSGTPDSMRDTAVFISSLEFVPVACNCPPQDVEPAPNGDGDVDLADFNIFQNCFNGPNRPYKLDDARCFCLDADHDADIDLADFNVFQNCFNGPNRPAKCLAGCTRGAGGGTMSASAELSEVVFNLYSPSNGQGVAAGTPLEWSVTVRATGLDAEVAGCAFDLELRQESEEGTLAKVALPLPTFATPFSDGSAVWSLSGPSNRPRGTLGGLGDAFSVPWTADSAARLAALSAEMPALPDASYVVSVGSIDTTSLAPGRYVLVLRPINANVLRSEEDLAGDVVGNFAAAARAVAGTRTVAFDVAK